MNLRSGILNRLRPYERIVVWGAGGLARTALTRWLPSEKITSVVDPTQIKQGSVICGHENSGARNIESGTTGLHRDL